MAMKKNHQWKMKEVEMLTTLYPVATRSEIAKKMGFKTKDIAAAIQRYGIEKVCTHTPAQKKMRRIIQFIKFLLHDKRTISQLAERFSIGSRTVYRYIGLLESMDVEVEQDFEGRFFIPPVCCPMCGYDKVKN